MSFTCPQCDMTSYHPEDEAQGYCGNCHDFTGDGPLKGVFSGTEDDADELG